MVPQFTQSKDYNFSSGSQSLLRKGERSLIAPQSQWCSHPLQKFHTPMYCGFTLPRFHQLYTVHYRAAPAILWGIINNLYEDVTANEPSTQSKLIIRFGCLNLRIQHSESCCGCSSQSHKLAWCFYYYDHCWSLESQVGLISLQYPWVPNNPWVPNKLNNSRP